MADRDVAEGHEHVGPTSEDFEPYRAEPGQTFGYTATDGTQVEIKAGGDGVVTPRNAAEDAVLASFDLKHAHVKLKSLRDEPVKRDEPEAPKKEG